MHDGNTTLLQVRSYLQRERIDGSGTLAAAANDAGAAEKPPTLNTASIWYSLIKCRACIAAFKTCSNDAILPKPF